MAESTLASFVIKLRHQIDPGSHKQFTDTVSHGIGQISLFKASLVGLGIAAEQTIKHVTSNFAGLYYLSRSTGVAALSIEKLRAQFVASGQAAEGADAQIEALTKTLMDPAFAGQLTRMVGRPVRDAADAFDGLVAAYDKALRASGGREFEGKALEFRRYLEGIGVSIGPIREVVLNLDAARHAADDVIKRLRIFPGGIDEATKRAAKLQLTFHEVGKTFEAAFVKILTDRGVTEAITKIADGIALWVIDENNQKRLDAFLKSFSDWMSKKENIDKLVTSMENLGTALGHIVHFGMWILENWANTINLLASTPAIPAAKAVDIPDAVKNRIQGRTGKDLAGEDDPELATGPIGLQGWNIIRKALGFQRGGIVPASLHAGEMVLPANISQGLQALYSGGGGGWGGGSDIQQLADRFDQWWSGDGSFRPIVEFGESVYDNLRSLFLEFFHLVGGEGGGAGAGGAAGAGGGGALGGGGGGGGQGGGGGGAMGTGGPVNAQGTGRGHVAPKAERLEYYRQLATEMGLNADAIVQTVANEGLNSYTGDYGKSFGDFQLYTGGGMGNQAVQAGINIRDPNTWKEQARFAMGQMAQHKGDAAWFGSQWHGPRGNAPWALHNFGNPSAVPPGGSYYSAGGAPAGGAPGSADMDPMAPAGQRARSENLVTIRTRNGVNIRVAAEFAENFKGFLSDYEKAGGVIGPDSGGVGERPGNESYHPDARAIDVNQIGYGIRSERGRTLPQSVEDALAFKWGMYPGSQFRNRSDIGHFEVRNAQEARAALERMRQQVVTVAPSGRWQDQIGRGGTPVSTGANAAGRMWALGDSIAVGLAGALGRSGSSDAIGGTTPKEIYTRLHARMRDFTNSDVSLASGSNPQGGFTEEQAGYVQKTLQELQAVHARVTLLGVGRGVKNFQGINRRLGEMAKQLNIPFTGELAGTETGRVHPDDYRKTLDQVRGAGGRHAMGSASRSLGGEAGRRAVYNDHSTHNTYATSTEPHGIAKAQEDMRNRHAANFIRSNRVRVA